MVKPCRQWLTEMCPVSFADGEAENDESRHGREFGPGGEILQ